MAGIVSINIVNLQADIYSFTCSGCNNYEDDDKDSIQFNSITFYLTTEEHENVGKTIKTD